jgi:hypothetical protein
MRLGARMNCSHENRVKVWTSVSGWELTNVLEYPRLRQQCRDCGTLFSRDFKHSLATADTPQVDITAAKRAVEHEKRIMFGVQSERLQAFTERRRQEDEEWWDRYSEYITFSPAWQHRRALVFKRADHVCEGCRERRATQIHHLTYRHVTNEFLWELVAICDVCHQRVHS